MNFAPGLLFLHIALFRTLSREQEAQAMGVGLKYSDNNRLWLTVYTRSFVSSVPSMVSALALWTTVLKITINCIDNNSTSKM